MKSFFDPAINDLLAKVKEQKDELASKGSKIDVSLAFRAFLACFLRRPARGRLLEGRAMVTDGFSCRDLSW